MRKDRLYLGYEGYYDPTAGKAITSIDKKKKRKYIKKKVTANV